jgi:ribosome-associated toxin RatA of RatAB toxin-antitoxin module
MGERVGVRNGFLVWEFRDLGKGSKQIEFKFEFQFQQPKRNAPA